MVDIAQTFLLLVATVIAVLTYRANRKDREHDRAARRHDRGLAVEEQRLHRIATRVVELGEQAVLDMEKPARGAHVNAARQNLKAALAFTTRQLPKTTALIAPEATSPTIRNSLLEPALDELEDELRKVAHSDGVESPG